MGKLIFNAQSTPVAPVGENKHTMFVDSCDGKLKMEDSTGNICTFECEKPLTFCDVYNSVKNILQTNCSDGDMSITTDCGSCWDGHHNVFLCAKEWNFNKFCVFPGVILRFCGNGMPIIKAKCFVNCGIINTRSGPLSPLCCSFLINGTTVNIQNIGSIGTISMTGGEGGGNGGGMGEGTGCGGQDSASNGCPGPYAGGGGASAGGYAGAGGNGDQCTGIGGAGGQGNSYQYNSRGGGGGWGIICGGAGGRGGCNSAGGNGGNSCYCNGGNGGDGYNSQGGDGGNSIFGDGGQGGSYNGKGGNSYYGNGGAGRAGNNERYAGNGGDSYTGNGGNSGSNYTCNTSCGGSSLGGAYGLIISADSFYNTCIHAAGGNGGQGGGQGKCGCAGSGGYVYINTKSCVCCNCINICRGTGYNVTYDGCLCVTNIF